MPTFDAGDVVEALDYDFTKAGIKGAAARGTVPEPTDAAIGRFLDGLKNLYEKSQKDGLAAEGLDETASPDQMLAALNSITGDAFVTFMADTAALFSELCGGHPATETLLQMPMRVRVEFYAWIQGEVVNPEAGPGAGTAVVRSLPSAAAG